MTVQFPARFVDINHRAIVREIEATVSEGQIQAPIRLVFMGMNFEIRKVNRDGTLVYHQENRTKGPR